MTETMGERVKFFRHHGAWSYDPATETKGQGKTRCARALARAEKRMTRLVDAGQYRYVWEPDTDTDAADYEPGVFPSDQEFWACSLERRTTDGRWEHRQSLCAIDCTHPEPYARVVEAELAIEELGR